MRLTVTKVENERRAQIAQRPSSSVRCTNSQHSCLIVDTAGILLTSTREAEIHGYVVCVLVCCTCALCLNRLRLFGAMSVPVRLCVPHMCRVCIVYICLRAPSYLQNPSLTCRRASSHLGHKPNKSWSGFSHILSNPLTPNHIRGHLGMQV